MSWIDKLQPASIGGVSIKVDGADDKGGLRLAKHEYPGADVGFVENLGQKLRGTKVDAYLIGTNYLDNLDALMAVLALGKAHELVHPWMGRKRVWVEDWSVSHKTDKGGYCVVSLDCVDAQRETPQATTDEVGAAQSEIEAAYGVCGADFLSDMDYPALLSEAKASLLDQIYTGLDTLREGMQRMAFPLDMLNAVVDEALQIKADVVWMLGEPIRYVERIRSIVSLFADTDYDNAQRVRVIDFVATPVQSPVRLPQHQAEAAFRERFYLLAAAQIAIARVFDSASEERPYLSVEARDAAAKLLSDRIDNLLPRLEQAQGVFEAFVQVRSRALDALASLELAPTRTKRIVSAMPSVVLAHNFGVAEGELIATNRIRHPLFVQGEVRYAGQD